MFRPTSNPMAALTVLTVFAASASSDAEERPRGPAPPTYSWPQQVFEIYRDAAARHDKRALFYCHAPQTRAWMIFEAAFQCQLSGRPEAQALLNRYGVRDDVINAEYGKRYHQKHGIDILRAQEAEKARIRRQFAQAPPGTQFITDEGGPPLPPPDNDLLREVTCDLIADKAGFIEAVGNLFDERRERSPYGRHVSEHTSASGETTHR